MLHKIVIGSIYGIDSRWFCTSCLQKSHTSIHKVASLILRRFDFNNVTVHIPSNLGSVEHNIIESELKRRNVPGKYSKWNYSLGTRRSFDNRIYTKIERANRRFTLQYQHEHPENIWADREWPIAYLFSCPECLLTMLKQTEFISLDDYIKWTLSNFGTAFATLPFHPTNISGELKERAILIVRKTREAYEAQEILIRYDQFGRYIQP